MSLGTVEPTGHSSDNKGRCSSVENADKNNGTACERDCGFKNSCFFQVIRYPMLLLNICCIAVPPACVGTTKFPQSKDLKVESISDVKNTLDGYKDVESDVVTSFHDRQKQEKLLSDRCRHSDSRAKSLIQNVTLIAMVLYGVCDIIRRVFIVVMTSNKEVRFILSLLGFTYMFTQFYLRVFNWHACSRNLKPLFSAVYAYEQQYGFKSDLKKFTQRAKIMFYIGTSYTAAQGLTIAFGRFFMDKDSLLYQTWPIPPSDGWWMYVTDFLFGIFSFFALIIITGSYCFKLAIVPVLTEEFQCLRKDVAKLMSQSKGFDDIEEKFDELIKRFRNLTDLTDRTYAVVKHTIGASYILGLPVMCLLLYGLISGSARVDQYFLLSWKGFETIAIAVGTTFLLAWLKFQARSVAEPIYAADWHKCSQQFFQQATIFISMFNNTSFGMTMYGMFVVDWSTLLMVGGTLLTYSIVIIQFQVDGPTPVCTCS